MGRRGFCQGPQGSVAEPRDGYLLSLSGLAVVWPPLRVGRAEMPGGYWRWGRWGDLSRPGSGGELELVLGVGSGGRDGRGAGGQAETLADQVQARRWHESGQFLQKRHGGAHDMRSPVAPGIL